MEYYYARIYGEDAKKLVERVCNAFSDIFSEYGNESSQTMPYGSHLGENSSSSSLNLDGSSDKLSGIDEWYAQA
ncbi:unnamed protein product, partial [Ilex paraguariensis]